MESNPIRVLAAGMLFLAIFVTGYRLSSAGKPYNALLFNFHKLIGLATGVFLGLIVYRAHQAAPLEALTIAVVAVTIVFAIATVAAGGLLSVAKPMPAFVGLVHKVFPYLTVASAAVMLYLLLLPGGSR